LQAQREYNAGMKSIQYTVRAVPAKLDKALRRQSKSSGKSLNEIVIAALEKGSGVNNQVTYHDLDWFIGGKSLPDEFSQDLNWLDSVPKDL
jgi:hypothetical protein